MSIIWKQIKRGINIIKLSNQRRSYELFLRSSLILLIIQMQILKAGYNGLTLRLNYMNITTTKASNTCIRRASFSCILWKKSWNKKNKPKQRVPPFLNSGYSHTNYITIFIIFFCKATERKIARVWSLFLEKCRVIILELTKKKEHGELNHVCWANNSNANKHAVRWHRMCSTWNKIQFPMIRIDRSITGGQGDKSRT